MRHSLIAGMAIVMSGCASKGPLERAATHDNVISAGKLTADTLMVSLDVRESDWFPDGDTEPSAPVWAFAADTGAPSVPGPMLRVREGALLKVSIRNGHPRKPLHLHGLQQRPIIADSVMIVPSGKTSTVVFRAGQPGTYFYWAAFDTTALDDRGADESQLAGVFIVDSVGATASDRVFMLGNWGVPVDSALGEPFVTSDLAVINGRSYPHTTPMNLVQGDTVRWRWVNPTDRSHPIHLHGLYFDVDHRGTWAADTAVEPQSVVTETRESGRTFSGHWIASEPGHWLAHCHFAFHVSHYLSVNRVADAPDPGGMDAVGHGWHDMRGMVIPINVTATAGLARRTTDSATARSVTLDIFAWPGHYGKTEGLAYVQRNWAGMRPSARPSISEPLVLERGVPVRITVRNHTRAPTSVHWHGVELPSFSDGVPGWSGDSALRALAVAPGDSFVAAFTPPRAGTFIYHSHSNELFQIASGLYGALLVVDRASYRPDLERMVVIGGNGADFEHGQVNGKLLPDTLTITAGVAYRFRIVAINVDWRTFTTLRSGADTLSWRLLAKDGAELTAVAQRMVPAAWMSGPGETLDVEVRHDRPGMIGVEVRGEGDEGWVVMVPVRVRTAP